MELDARLIITIGGMLASVITSFIVVRQKVAELEEDVKSALKKSSQLDSRLDKNDTSTDLVSQRLSVISNMMDPTNRERLHRSLERMQTEIEHLRKDVDAHRTEYLKSHNGKHPPVEGSS
tara:strand:+ start:174 stop:533 length:360 start_codon:yes stop_codon:yes gene_type:complete